MFVLLSFLTLFLPGGPPIKSSPKANLRVDIQNVSPLKGAVYVALFKPGKDFPDGKPVEGNKVDVTSNNLQTTFSVEPGEYAIAVFHDENSNGKLDKKIFGIPKEPYGFSNNFRPKLSVPKFRDCQFSVGSGGKTVSIALKNF